jgi:hypothetical protein
LFSIKEKINMKNKFLALTMFFVLSFCAISFATSPGGGGDTISPGKISTFTVITDFLLKLTWTAPGNDGYSGNVPAGGAFSIRYSTNSSATGDTAEGSITISSSWVTGSVQTLVLSTGTVGLSKPLIKNTTYYVWIKACDDAGNWCATWSDRQSAVSGGYASKPTNPEVFPSSNTVITKTFSSGGKQLTATISIASGTVNNTSFLDINFDPASLPKELVDATKINTADNKLSENLGRYAILIELNLYDIFGNRITNFFNNPITITISYPDDNNDGIIDGTNPELSAYLLKFYVLDETNGEWVLAGGDVDTNKKTITATLGHFSVYGLISSKASSNNLKKVIVYPNPYKPGTGGKYDRSDGIIFSNLTEKAEIKIYTISGELVRSMNKNNHEDRYVWDTKNNSGNTVASGVYIYRITNPDNSSDKTKGKVAIIR